MASIPERLRAIRVNLSQILLDPNNPRFADLEETLPVLEPRFHEDKVQKDAFDKIRDHKQFELTELRDTILALGFLPVDRIVVRSINTKGSTENYYAVVEGNRRVAALRWIVQLNEAGKIDLTEAQIDNYTNLEVLLLDVSGGDKLGQMIIPGLRHVSGVKEWIPYQKAALVNLLRESGKEPKEAAQSLGIPTRQANLIRKAFLAHKQMQEEEEYGDYADPRKYSYFEEVLKRPIVRDWLGWDDNAYRFTNDTNLRLFYSWMPKAGADTEDNDAKLPEAKSIRELGRIMENEEAIKRFSAEDGSLINALAILEKPDPTAWKGVVREADNALKGIAFTVIQSFTRDDLDLVEGIGKRAHDVLEAYRKMKGKPRARSKS